MSAYVGRRRGTPDGVVLGWRTLAAEELRSRNWAKTRRYLKDHPEAAASAKAIERGIQAAIEASIAYRR